MLKKKKEKTLTRLEFRKLSSYYLKYIKTNSDHVHGIQSSIGISSPPVPVTLPGPVGYGSVGYGSVGSGSVGSPSGWPEGSSV